MEKDLIVKNNGKNKIKSKVCHLTLKNENGSNKMQNKEVKGRK